MQRSLVLAGAFACALPASIHAAPIDVSRSVSLPAQSLGASLQVIARRFGIEMLFSQTVVNGHTAPAASGRLTFPQALDLLLTGSGLEARRTAEGSYVIAVIPVATSEPSEATPEILVIGRRTQNTDVWRTENDVRPYQVITRQDVARAHIATVEELATRRLPANAQGPTLSQRGADAQGETASSINLRGLGTEQTLVLVDGRRLPQMPGQDAAFLQSDVNALPPEAIERVEAITATAGGIYGPGATAGVVNLVLRRDYRGAEIAVTGGITARGDAPYRRADVRLGFTPDHGSTDVMIDLSRSVFGGLDIGDRDFLQRADTRSFANLPSYYIQSAPPTSRSLNIVSDDGSPLVLKAAYGGVALGSPITFAPPADGRPAAMLASILIANRGTFDLTPASGAAGDAGTLLSGRRTSSVIASARHRSGAFELFADYLLLHNRGHARLPTQWGIRILAPTVRPTRSSRTSPSTRLIRTSQSITTSVRGSNASRPV